MALVDDLDFLLGKHGEMEEFGHILGIEEELRQFRGVLESVRKERATDDYESPGQLGEINYRVNEMLEKIWCWHERHRGTSSSPSSSSSSSVVKLADVITRFYNNMKADAVTRFYNNMRFRTKIASELKELMSEYQRQTGVRSSAAYSAERETHPELEVPGRIVGRDEDVENIIMRIDQLRQQAEENDHKLHIIPIVGVPGIGKTTVAQMIYAHPWMEHNFDLRIWVHVSPCFYHKRVLRRMANFLVGTDSFDDDEDEDSIHDILKEKLKGRRYLLVLDDVWNEDQGKWDALKQQLLDISWAQVTVIVTTTRHRVAELMAANSLQPYELQRLSEADCLQLFHQFLQEEELQVEDEERVHKTIQEKLYGLPMEVFDLTQIWVHKYSSLKYLQGFISTRMEIWYNSVFWRYEQLPIYLRSCFQFCSLFPEGHDYDMEELGEIWLAQRWYAAAAAIPHPESIHFAELWKDCFFLSSTEDKVTYKMHSMMHHFANYFIPVFWEYVNSFELMGTSKIVCLQCVRMWVHFSMLVDTEILEFPKFPFPLKKLKTLILLREPQMLLLNHKCKISRIPPELLASMKHLCVLDLQYTMIKKLPRTMENLLNLRYLNLSGTDLTTLPRCIGKLQSLMFLKLVNCKQLRRLNDIVTQLVNLQKLDIAGCDCLVHVPNRIDSMKQLRCINLKDCSSMIQMPYGLGQFTKLHTLPRYIVGENDGHTIEELQTLKGLEGELRVDNLQKVAGGIDAANAELGNKTMLKSLTLQWKWRKHEDEAKDTKAIQEVLEELRPNKDLIKLKIISFMGKQFPKWMSRNPPYLASLEEIKLFNLKRCQELPPLGVLPRLRVAEISGLDAITTVDDAFYGADGTFPSLQRLTFSQMLKLEKWSDVRRRNMFPCLTNLTIINCPQMMALEMELPSVTELAMWLNNGRLYSSKGGLKGLAGSLKKLSISLCEKLSESSECEGLQELRVLEEMEMSGCQELSNLPIGIRHLNSIKSLTITCCNKLTTPLSWSNDELTSLRSLSINGCNLLCR